MSENKLENPTTNTDSTTNGENEAKIIKIKPSKKRSYRKKQQTEESSNDDEDEIEKERLLILEVTKELQKKRLKTKGIEAGKTLTPSSLMFQHETTRKDPETTVVGRLDAQFTMETTVNVEDVYMTKFIEDKIKEKRMGTSTDKFVDESNRKRTDDDILFSVPDHLKSQSNVVDPGTGGITNILEVELPDEYRLKNIEATEKARQAYLDNKTQGTSSNNGSGHSDSHKRFMKPGNIVNPDVASKGKATDDIVLENFKKRFRY